MAQTARRKKNSTAKRSSGTRKTTRSSSAGKARTRTSEAVINPKKPGSSAGTAPDPVWREVSVLIVLAVSVLMLLGNFGLGGRAGSIISQALFGSLGLTAWILPFVVFFGFSFIVANSKNALIGRKVIGGLMFLVFLTAFLHILTEDYRTGLTAADFYAVSSADRTGGGVVGGVIIRVLGDTFGRAGAAVIILIGLVVSAIIATQKPLITDLGKKGRRAAKRARYARSTEREARRERRRREEEEDWSRRGHRLQEEEDWERNYDEPLSAPEPVDPLSAATLKAEPGTTRGHDQERRKSSAKKAKTESKNNPDTGSEEIDLSSLRIDGENPSAFRMPAFLGSVERDKNPSAVSETVSDEGEPVFEIQASPVEPDPAKGVSSEPVRTDSEASPAQESENKEPAVSGRRARKPRTVSKEDQEDHIGAIQSEINVHKDTKPEYVIPDTRLLTRGKAQKADSRQHLMETAAKLQKTLQDFGVNVKVVNVTRGPTVTRYELQPEQGVKVSRIINLQDDIKLNLATPDIRIEAPIPGKAAVGIEVPNKEAQSVNFRELIESEEFRESKACLSFAVGKDLGGRPVITDIEKMPHLLIAGATGSGKSVCINTLIMSILFKAKPDEVKMLMIDPKVVELKIYDGIPHLLIPVVTDAKKAAGALNWAVHEMTERYNKFAGYPGVRDIRSYNDRITKLNEEAGEGEQIEKLPQIVVIVDELADLMMVSSSEVEDAICRLAQLARAAGIHLIIATQRPSVNVVTGLIKANMPSRIALAVSSGVDSRTILDMNGAEKLLGKGDMLFYPQGYPKPARVQGAFVSDSDISKVVQFLLEQGSEVEYNKEVEEQIAGGAAVFSTSTQEEDDRDEYFADAGRLIIEKEKASIGMLQRAFKIGFNRAARVMDQLCDAGVVGGEEGTKPRRILMTMDEFEAYLHGEQS